MIDVLVHGVGNVHTRKILEKLTLEIKMKKELMQEVVYKVSR